MGCASTRMILPPSHFAALRSRVACARADGSLGGRQQTPASEQQRSAAARRARRGGGLYLLVLLDRRLVDHRAGAHCHVVVLREHPAVEVRRHVIAHVHLLRSRRQARFHARLCRDTAAGSRRSAAALSSPRASGGRRRRRRGAPRGPCSTPSSRPGCGCAPGTRWRSRTPPRRWPSPRGCWRRPRR